MIFAIKPFETHDGDGIRTTVFFKGCPLSCKWCHNPESLSATREISFDSALCVHCGRCVGLCDANVMQGDKHVFLREKCTLCGKCEGVCPKSALEIAGQDRTAEDIAAEVLRDEMFMKGSGGGVTFSGGEPLMQADFCVELAKLLKAHDLNIAVDTSGYVPRESIDKMLPYTDTFLWDVKAIDDEVHRRCTGVSNERILENLRYVDSLGVPIEVRYPFVPGQNSDEAEAIGRFLSDLRSVKGVRVLAYHNFATGKYRSLGLEYPLSDTPRPTAEELEEAKERIRRCGVNVL